MNKKIISFALSSILMIISLTTCSATTNTTAATNATTAVTLTTSTTMTTTASETKITLSDSGVKVNDNAVSNKTDDAVLTNQEIVYYESGKGSDYGEGTEADAHSAQDASKHTVVTITKAGTYRLSGTLLAGQVAIDLGEDAKSDPTAVVTLILDGVDITCSIAPAIIFYNVYECGSADTATAINTVDTKNAGANIVIADGTVNKANGSYVARIYKEGTTKKLHKYDGAVYSKMSMNVTGEALNTGELHIEAENEGLDSELHLTINGGKIYIDSQDDGINTNEDGVSVTTINGGYLYVNGGLGSEGDGIDSNGFLVINGGIIVALANGRSGDGGIDADSDIIINGGTVIALGSRNDATGTASKQPFMELSYATTQKAGTIIRVEDEAGKEILTFAPLKDYQSLTFSSSDLQMDKTYYVLSGGTIANATQENGLYKIGGTYSGGVIQQYTGNSFGMGGGMRGGGRGGEGFEPPEGMELPEGFDPSQFGDRPQRDGNFDNGQRPERGQGGQPRDNSGEITLPEGFGEAQSNASNNFSSTTSETKESIEFIITSTIHSFSGVSESAEASGKTRINFLVNVGKGIDSVGTGENIAVPNIEIAALADSTSVNIEKSDVQITITDIPSESFAKTVLLSDGEEKLAQILPSDDGTYQLTVSVISSNQTYTGTNQWTFNIGKASSGTFNDVDASNPYYDAIEFVKQQGIMSGTGSNMFSPNLTVSRAMAITVLSNLAKAETVETNSFTDVKSGSWYSPFIGWAIKNSIVEGYGNGLFGPDDAVTRQQMCVIVYNYAKTSAIDLGTGESTYSDNLSIADWAKEAVNACQFAGILDDIVSENKLNPASDLTRAEMASILMKLAEFSTR